MSPPFRLTDTRRDVLQLIAEGRPLGDYVPRYRPGARRGRGAFPVTIAERAERDLRRAGLVEQGANGEPVITAAGRQALAEKEPVHPDGGFEQYGCRCFGCRL